MQSFLSLGLSEALAQGLSALGFEGPTAIQSATIPALLAGSDLLMESETGTGKTFAYLAPALTFALARKGSGKEGPAAIVAAPTQELAVQIGREAERLAAASGLELPIAVLLGGTPIVKQEVKLKERPLLVIGTLGRLADLVALRKLKVAALKLLVLDEADRILAPESEELGLALLAAAPRDCCRVLASATLPDRTRRSAAPFLRDPHFAEIDSRPVLAGDIEHWCFYCDSRKRVDFLRRFEAAVRPKRCLVFLSNASRVESVVERLAARGLPVEGIHARLEKEARRHALDRFVAGEIRYLVTSDLGARGLDIAGISHVLSLDLPDEHTVYVHRAGRTGRAGATGVSVILVDRVELKRASRIAVRQGFSFRTKVLEGGDILEPSAEEFFALVERAESERHESYLKRSAPREARAPARPFDRNGPPSDRSGPPSGRNRPPIDRPRPARIRPEEAAGEPRPEPRPESRPEPRSWTGAIPGVRRPAFDGPRLKPDIPPSAPEGRRPTSDRPQLAPDRAQTAPDRSRAAPDRSRTAPDRPRAAPDRSRTAPDRPRVGAERQAPVSETPPLGAERPMPAPRRAKTDKAQALPQSSEAPAAGDRPKAGARRKALRNHAENDKKATPKPARPGAERRLAEKKREEAVPERRLGKKEREAERRKEWPGHRQAEGKGKA